MADRLRNFVDGKSIDAHDGHTTMVMDPGFGQDWTPAPSSGPADVDRSPRRRRVAGGDGVRIDVLDEDRAVARANGVEYGLASSVWTSDHGRGDEGVAPAGPRLSLDRHSHPGGGRNAPRWIQALGLRQDLSIYGLEDYTRIKHVMSSFE